MILTIPFNSETSLPLLLKSCCHWEIDGDQQLNFYYCDPVAKMDRFICQPKFAGKTYMKFERQELKKWIRPESKLPISGSQAHRLAQSPIAAFTLMTNLSQACIELRIPCTMIITTACNILHKQQKLNMQHILHSVHIYMDNHTSYSAAAESCLNIHHPWTSKWKQRNGFLWLGCPLPLYDSDKSKLP